MKKICSLTLLCVMILCLSISAAAVEEDAGKYDPNATCTASSTWAAARPSLSHSTPYTMSITNLEEKHSTYTKYYFSPNDEKLQISGTLSQSGDQDNVERSVKILLFQVGNDATNQDSYTVSFNGSTFISHTFLNLQPNANYYFRIDNLNSHPPYAKRYVDGSLTIQ